MSARETTTLYEQVINDVISDSRQDFEDNGIDEQTLQDLKSLWQQNLANSQVANLSWAPLTAPYPQPVHNDQKRADSATSNSTVTTSAGTNFEFQMNDNNGDIAKTLHKQRESELKKERTLASLDSDDINSDLDDSDDDEQDLDEENEDNDGMIILCLYEKVLRVKNKWKCTLKDGIASVHGRDYAFAKASGESEW